MSRVFIVNASGHNHHLAKRFGELTPITTGYVSKGSLDRLHYTLVETIAESSPDDYLLLSGLMFLNALAAAIWITKHGSLQILDWDRKHGDYRLFTTDREHILELWSQIDEWGEGSSSSPA